MIPRSVHSGESCCLPAWVERFRTGRRSTRPERAPESKRMPAEQALTKARELSGPSRGSRDGGSKSSAARLEQLAALFAPIALIVGLALSGGGFDVSTRHI